MPLANIERKFAASLLRKQGDDAGFLSELLPLDSINKEMQLSIYRSNVNGAHQKVLAQVYPACFNILGGDYFNQLCRLYRFEYPSSDADLNNYGKHFSLFMQNQIILHKELKGMEYLSELANLEWRWHASYYEKNDEVFSFEDLALVNADEQNKIFFKTSHSFSLYSTLYPLLDIWNTNKDLVDIDQEFYLSEYESYFCISRNDFSPKIDLLSYKQYKLLSLISKKSSLTKLVELDYEGCFEKELIYFIQQGWVTGFYLKV